MSIEREFDNFIETSNFSITAPLRTWMDQLVASNKYKSPARYIAFLIDADMGPAKTLVPSRVDWITAQVKSRNFPTPDAYIRHLIARDMDAANPRTSVGLSPIETELLSHVLHIRGVVDDMQRKLAEITKA